MMVGWWQDEIYENDDQCLVAENVLLCTANSVRAPISFRDSPPSLWFRVLNTRVGLNLIPRLPMDCKPALPKLVR